MTAGVESRVPLLEGFQQEDTAASKRFASIRLLRPWFPNVGPDDPPVSRWKNTFSDRDVALLLILSTSTALLVFNLSVTIYTFVKFGVKENIGDILGPENGGDCEKVKYWNRWFHFAINALSTILLGASNYCAQLLVAPTRQNVEDAHKKKTWLDIGVQSFRNLWYIDSKRRSVWIALMLSSGLLHLFWNSAVFAATPFNLYEYGYVTADFLEDSEPWMNPLSNMSLIRQNVSHLRRMPKQECIDNYVGKAFSPGSLLLVSANVTMADNQSFAHENPGSSLLYNRTTLDPGGFWPLNSDWMCSAWSSYGKFSRYSCTPKVLNQHAKDWTLARFESDHTLWMKVDYCIPWNDRPAPDDKCVSRISKAILVVVMALNLAKCICIAYTCHLHLAIQQTEYDGVVISKFKSWLQAIFRPRRESNDPVPHLVTIGDAIASFLRKEDVYTKGFKWATKYDFERKWPLKTRYPVPSTSSTHWFRAASVRRWTITVSTMGVVGGLFQMTISAQREQNTETDLASLWSYGLGVPQQFATAMTGFSRSLSQSGAFFFAVMFANSFQLIFSALYLLYNNLMTAMVVAAEWNDFITERKTLRLSSPRGIQRSNYFLSLPYRYAIPLMAISGFLHWFISQSVFVIQTVGYTTPSLERAYWLDRSWVGFSSIGIIFCLSGGSILVLALVLIGFTFVYRVDKVRKTDQIPPYTMPLVGTCSAAISANCHKHEDDKECWLLPLRWGFVEGWHDGTEGRFTFTTAATLAYPSR